MAAKVSVVSDIGGRYATALFELAREQNQLDAVAADMESLRRALEESADLRHLVSSPVFGRGEQGRAMNEVARRMELGQTVVNFAGVVSSHGRLFALKDMTVGFARLLAEHRGEVTASVTAARPLSEAQQRQIQTELAAAMKTEVSIETEIDESILGGLVVRVGSRMIDSSIKTKLQNLQFAMKGAE